MPSKLFSVFSTFMMIIFCCRALYFTAYSQAKQFYNGIFTYESPAVHLVSAISAGVCVWLCKCESSIASMMQHCTKIERSMCCCMHFLMPTLIVMQWFYVILCKTADLNLVGLREGRTFSSYFGFMLAWYQGMQHPLYSYWCGTDSAKIHILTSLVDVSV